VVLMWKGFNQVLASSAVLAQVLGFVFLMML
jgi:hypothetical protein